MDLKKEIKDKKIKHVEQNIIYFYLKNKKINYNNQCIISDFLSDHVIDESFEVFSSMIENVNDMSKEFENLINLKTKKENGSIYTPYFIVEQMKNLSTISKNSLILEPSVGGGIFIFEILLYFKSVLNKSIKASLKENIYMNDIDLDSIQRLQVLIAIYALENEENINYSDLNITNFDFIEKDFDHFYSDFKFDLVIGNPPYLSLEKGFLKEDIERYKREYHSIFKVYDIFGIFIEKSIRFLDKNGELIFIVPATLFTNDSFEKLRLLMLSKNIEQCLHLGDKVFENAVVPSCIFKLSNKKQQDKITLKYDNKYCSSNIDDIIGDKNSLRLGIDYEFNKEIIKYKKNKSNTTLGNIVDIKEAIKTGNDKKFINNEFSEGFKPLVKGRDINPLAIKQKLYLNYIKEELSRPLTESFFEQNKIFIRRVSNKIIAAYDNKFLYATHTLYCAFQHKNKDSVVLSEEDLELITILLNSYFYSKMYITLFPFKGTVFPEIRTTKLRQLVFPSIPIIRDNKNDIDKCVVDGVILQDELEKIIKVMLNK